MRASGACCWPDSANCAGASRFSRPRRRCRSTGRTFRDCGAGPGCAGYPGNRFHGGGEHVDAVERLAIARKELFGAAYANVQPHSGTQANQAVFFALLLPGDRILSLNLADGGHLSHGAGAGGDSPGGGPRRGPRLSLLLPGLA